jgi:hypothetical protein
LTPIALRVEDGKKSQSSIGIAAVKKHQRRARKEKPTTPKFSLDRAGRNSSGTAGTHLHRGNSLP